MCHHTHAATRSEKVSPTCDGLHHDVEAPAMDSGRAVLDDELGLDDAHLAHFRQQLVHRNLVGRTILEREIRQLFDRAHLVVVGVDHRIDGAKSSPADDAALLVGIDCVCVVTRLIAG